MTTDTVEPRLAGVPAPRGGGVMADQRKLERRKHAGVYRRPRRAARATGAVGAHTLSAGRIASRPASRCSRRLISLAMFKGELDSGKRSRRPLSSQMVGDYFSA
jgi:hypothetical protein